MKVAFYCQHVLGMGHFFRSREIARCLAVPEGNEVALISGGRAVEAALPSGVRLVPLPGLAMTEDFGSLYSLEPGLDLEAVKAARAQALREFCTTYGPDVLLVELFPFGRNQFRFELAPLLDAVRAGSLRTVHGRPPKVVCSVRDILVEKRDPAKYEARVVECLNRWFDLVLVHADPKLQALDETFSRLGDIRPPLAYTGFVTPRPAPGSGPALRAQLGLRPEDKLVVASAGGGQVGGALLAAVLRAFALLGDLRVHLLVFSGPHLPQADFDALGRLAAQAPMARLERFTDRFLEHLAAADLSISQGGYNTTMNILAAGVPALVQPFDQNREQRLRATKLARLGILDILEPQDLEPETLAARLRMGLERPRRAGPPSVDLNGAATTATLLHQLVEALP